MFLQAEGDCLDIDVPRNTGIGSPVVSSNESSTQSFHAVCFETPKTIVNSVASLKQFLMEY